MWTKEATSIPAMKKRVLPKCQRVIKQTESKRIQIFIPAKGKKKKSKTLAFSSATLYTRKQWINVFKALRENNFILRILSVSKEQVKCEYKFNICSNVKNSERLFPMYFFSGKNSFSKWKQKLERMRKNQTWNQITMLLFHKCIR